jgi:biotin-independent malonate decarboxylase gamma subunit
VFAWKETTRSRRIFCLRMLAQVDPARIHSLHLLISVLSRPEHMELFERKIASHVDFSFVGPQAYATGGDGCQSRNRAIVAIVDVPGQAFGWHEEALGIHLALAAAVDAYVTARELVHPVIALVVGKAISGAFLAHGLQANEILALDDDGVEVHVTSEASSACVTRRSPKDVAALAKIVPSTARDVRSFAGLGGIDRLIKVGDAAEPDAAAIENVRQEILAAVGRAREPHHVQQDPLRSTSIEVSQGMSLQVRQELESQWTTDG